jgi:hypothetical protein
MQRIFAVKYTQFFLHQWAGVADDAALAAAQEAGAATVHYRLCTSEVE